MTDATGRTHTLLIRVTPIIRAEPAATYNSNFIALFSSCNAANNSFDTGRSTATPTPASNKSQPMPAMNPQITGYGSNSNNRVSWNWPTTKKHKATVTDVSDMMASIVASPRVDIMSTPELITSKPATDARITIACSSSFMMCNVVALVAVTKNMLSAQPHNSTTTNKGKNAVKAPAKSTVAKA